MILTGLVSVTFRKLMPEQIIDLVRRAGLDGIEWGGDVHVPHGDLAKAIEVGRRTRDAGICISAYGSYYRVGSEEGESFQTVLETARQLGAPVVRVWAGMRGSAETNRKERERVVAVCRQIAEEASEANVVVACEYHGGTLTDANESALRLLGEVNHPNFRSYWQPRSGDGMEGWVAGLEGILPFLGNLHVFHWTELGRLPLSAGRERWRTFLEVARRADGDRFASLEFVRADSIDAFVEDAKVLKELVVEENRVRA